MHNKSFMGMIVKIDQQSNTRKKDVMLTEILECSFVFPQALINLGEFQYNTVKGFYTTAFSFSSTHRFNDSGLELRLWHCSPRRCSLGDCTSHFKLRKTKQESN